MIDRRVIISILAIMGLTIFITIGALIMSRINNTPTVSYRDPNTGVKADEVIVNKTPESGGAPTYEQGFSLLNAEAISEKLPDEQIGAISQELSTLLWHKTGRTDHTAYVVAVNDTASEITIVVTNPRSVFKATVGQSTYTATGDIAVGDVNIEQVIDLEKRYE